jgi:hypothetical protein
VWQKTDLDRTTMGKAPAALSGEFADRRFRAENSLNAGIDLPSGRNSAGFRQQLVGAAQPSYLKKDL